MVEMLCVPFVIQCKFPQFGFHWLIKAFAMEQETLANQVIYLVGDQCKALGEYRIWRVNSIVIVLVIF